MNSSMQSHGTGVQARYGDGSNCKLTAESIILNTRHGDLYIAIVSMRQ